MTQDFAENFVRGAGQCPDGIVKRYDDFAPITDAHAFRV